MESGHVLRGGLGVRLLRDLFFGGGACVRGCGCGC